MHTYRKAEGGTWEVVFQQTDIDVPIGPDFTLECEAAAYASYLNGGRYCPDEIAHIFPKEHPAVTDDDESIHPDRPKAFDDDYPLEAYTAARKLDEKRSRK